MEIRDSSSNLCTNYLSTFLPAPQCEKADKYRCSEPGSHISSEMPQLAEAHDEGIKTPERK